jgi:hypothetical protein
VTAIPTTDATYLALSQEFDHVFWDNRGGVNLTYITGEQAISRLNEVLGHDGWSFRIISSTVVEDEVLVLGELAVLTEGDPSAIRQQYGSQKIKRKRDSSTILDIGFDYKGAATDALKKCASMIGVGLYLSKKEEQAPRAPQVPREAPPPQQWDTNGNELTTVPGQTITCEVCGEEMKDTVRKDGSVWTANEKAAYSQKQYHGRILCYNCSRNAG